VSISEDRWLSERFGHPVFGLDSSQPAERMLTELREELAGRRTASYQAKIPAARVELVHALGALGFRVVSVTITLRRRPPEFEQEQPGVGIGEARSELAGALANLAEAAVTRDRFHLDPAIPDRVARRVKRDWVANCVTGGRCEGVLVAAEDDVPLGFLAVTAGRRGDEHVRVIDLMAVAAESRGRGVGGALVKRFLDDSRGTCDHVRVGTQAANPEAIRFYQGMGFFVEEAAYDLHLHVGDPWSER
jgi:GNAT superfamily N-acetyltransferase